MHWLDTLYWLVERWPSIPHPYTVETLYNTIVFHQNTHKRHPIARPSFVSSKPDPYPTPVNVVVYLISAIMNRVIKRFYCIPTCIIVIWTNLLWRVYLLDYCAHLDLLKTLSHKQHNAAMVVLRALAITDSFFLFCVMIYVVPYALARWAICVPP